LFLFPNVSDIKKILNMSTIDKTACIVLIGLTLLIPIVVYTKFGWFGTIMLICIIATLRVIFD
jgi:hypothetical protein